MSLLFIFRRRVCGDANEVREKSSLLSLWEREKRRQKTIFSVYLSLCNAFKTSILIIYYVSKSCSKRASSQTRNDV